MNPERQEMVLTYDRQIIAIIEAWLSPDIAYFEIVRQTHKIIRRDWGCRGGIVALVIKNILSYVILNKIDANEEVRCQGNRRGFSVLVDVV